MYIKEFINRLTKGNELVIYGSDGIVLLDCNVEDLKDFEGIKINYWYIKDNKIFIIIY